MSLFPANLNFKQGALEILGKIGLLRFLWLFVENFKSIIYHSSFLQGVVWICMKVYPVNLPSSWTRCALLCRDKARTSLKKKRGGEGNENREENPAKANMGMGTLNMSWNMALHELLVCFLARAWKRTGKKDRPCIWDWVSAGLYCLFGVSGYGYSQGRIHARCCVGRAWTVQNYRALSLAGGRGLLSRPPLPHTWYTLLQIASTNIGLKTVRIAGAWFSAARGLFVSVLFLCHLGSTILKSFLFFLWVCALETSSRHLAQCVL